MKKQKMMTMLLMSALLAGTVLSGCAQKQEPANGGDSSKNSNTSTPAASNEAESSEPVTIKWVRAANEQDPEKDRILLELQKRTNTKIEIISIPNDQFANKVSLMIASGEDFDLATVDAGKAMIEWAKNDLIYPYDEFLESGNYPHLKAVINADVYKGFRIDGKAYFKPLGLAPMQWGWIIRQDWLDNLGLKMPTTIEEFYNVIKAFKEEDPDKNGKDDTYGIYTRASGMSDPSISQLGQFINRAYVVAGRTDNWVTMPDGSITRFEASPYAKESAAFFKKLVDENLINKDWLSLKPDGAQGPESDDFGAGKYGIAVTSKPDLFVQKAQSVNPDAKIAYLPPLQGENGTPANSGHSGGFWRGTVIPKTSKNPEKVLELIEYTHTKEGRELTLFGIEGTHFTDVKEENGNRIYTINEEEMSKDWDTNKNGFLYPLSWGAMNYFEYGYIPIEENNFNYDEAFTNLQPWITTDMAKGSFPDWFAINSKYSIAPPLMNVFDDNLLGDQGKLRSAYGEGWLKAIMSKDFDKDWNELQQKWLAAGGQDIIAYGQEYYKTHQ
ncbi:extracellular solute-binding protein [Paenibacillus arenilitoris]|uniref:Extracellular solute-binding protein n=1 Tax=Paenibacillus arenilitoris TaxID=2772299 RepID=A0A927H5I4_9BACL|nr:extracellular solute-binding protein [Paenibacillus arenilitoris]MBD2868985.1 extracellular solute-binding protein [Paenibacillus arenilitoris]